MSGSLHIGRGQFRDLERIDLDECSAWLLDDAPTAEESIRASVSASFSEGIKCDLRAVHVALGEDAPDSAQWEFPYLSPAAQEPHTDASFMLRPYDLVALFCVTPGDPPTPTRLLHVQDLVDCIAPEQRAYLQQAVFPFEFGLAPILSFTRPHWQIRYSWRELQHYARVHACSAESIAVAETLRHLLNTMPMTDVLPASAQVLIIDNSKVLHGRRRIPVNSGRMLYRFRCHRNLRDDEGIG